MAKGFWDNYNKKQRDIMEEREKANKGKTFKPIKPGNRTPVTQNKKPTEKNQTKKK